MVKFIIATRKQQAEYEDNFQLNYVNFSNIFGHIKSCCTSTICLKTQKYFFILIILKSAVSRALKLVLISKKKHMHKFKYKLKNLKNISMYETFGCKKLQLQ